MSNPTKTTTRGIPLQPQSLPSPSNSGVATTARQQPNQRQRQQANTTTTATTSPSSTGSNEAGPTPDELKYYMEQIYHIIKPVMMCITLSVIWVKISMAGSDFRPQSNAVLSVYQESSGDSSGQVFLGSLQNALIIIGMIVLATILFVILFKFGCWKFMHGYLFLTVAMLLGFMGYLLALNVIQVFSIPVDLITLVFGLYNFAVVGIVAVFSAAPLWLQQAYLVIMSSIMAFSLTGLDSWTTWFLLGILAIWDLIAVLCPYGPLKILVETSQRENREIPALLYSVTMAWIGMASPASTNANNNNNSNNNANNNNNNNHGSHNQRHPQELPAAVESSSGGSDNNNNSNNSAAVKSFRRSSTISPAEIPLVRENQQQKIQSSDIAIQSTSAGQRLPPQRRNRGAEGAGGDNNNNNNNTNNNDNQEDDDDEERRGLRLGLGDFVFYSVLIARTSMTDWITTFACVVAVLTGMNLTIFLLAIYRKALPALPISIAFGIFFYFVSAYSLVPYINYLGLSAVII